MQKTKKIYHERHIRQLSALHTLNNLFQGKDKFTKEDLDEICNFLEPIKRIIPRPSLFELGNYDFNVIMTALQLRKKCETIFFDERKDPACIEYNYKALVGFILSVPIVCKLGFIPLPFRKRHWFAVRKIGDDFYNLDSKLNAPQRIGNEIDLIIYLRKHLEAKGHQLILVIKIKEEGLYDVYGDPRWLKSEDDSDDDSNSVQEET